MPCPFTSCPDKLVPRLETLLVLQALLVISGLIPLCLLARGFSKCTATCLCFRFCTLTGSLPTPRLWRLLYDLPRTSF